jgi:predicted nucleotidyltransferase
MFETDVLDRTLKTRRRQRNWERVVLIDRVASALRVCREKYGVREAFIVGSLLFFHRWDHKSDVDVAIGGAPDRVLDVMKVVEDAVDRDVDVIDLDLHMSADRFRQKGMKIYG